MQMWGSAVGVGATPEAMVQTLRNIPIATDIVDRINKHCEWIHIILQALAFFAQASREEGLVLQRGQLRYSKDQLRKFHVHILIGYICIHRWRTWQLRKPRENSPIIVWSVSNVA